MNVKLAVCLALLAGASSVVAQPNTGAPNAAFGGDPEGAMEWRALPLKHSAPRVIAWQLDPLGNLRPPAATRDEALRIYRKRYPNSAGERMFAGDGSVRAIVPAETQQTLLVLASAAGFERVREMVRVLDKAAQRFEFEAQWVQITPDDAVQLGFLMGVPSVRQAHSTRANYREKLETLIAENRAVVLSSRSFGAAEGEETRVVLSQSAPLPTWSEGEASQAKLPLRAAITLTITVTETNINIIDFRVGVARELLLARPILPAANRDEMAGFGRLTKAPSPAALSVQSDEAIERSGHLLSGQTLALTGFSTEWLVAQDQPIYDGKELPKNVILLLSARLADE